VVFAAVVAGAAVALADHQASELAQAEEPPAMTPAPSASANHFTGMITDSRCGARHMRNSYQNATECARACFRKGATYVLIDGDKRYTLIGGEGDLSKFAGERATVTGSRQGDTILVDSAASMF
jgi:hypothetical protein